jgi:flagellar motor switch protein FliM
LLELGEGDIIRLNIPADDIVHVSVDGKERFVGRMGLRRFHKSIQITSLIETEKDAVKRALKEFENRRKARISGVKEMIRGPVEDEEDDDE